MFCWHHVYVVLFSKISFSGKASSYNTALPLEHFLVPSERPGICAPSLRGAQPFIQIDPAFFTSYPGFCLPTPTPLTIHGLAAAIDGALLHSPMETFSSSVLPGYRRNTLVFFSHPFPNARLPAMTMSDWHKYSAFQKRKNKTPCFNYSLSRPSHHTKDPHDLRKKKRAALANLVVQCNIPVDQCSESEAHQVQGSTEWRDADRLCILYVHYRMSFRH